MIEADGRFSLGYPRKDGGEEINARVRLTDRPIADLRHAFQLDDYRWTAVSRASSTSTASTRRPYGFGRLTITDGMAYGEPFEARIGGAALRGRRRAPRRDRGDEGRRTAHRRRVRRLGRHLLVQRPGRRMPVETMAALAYPQAPLSGLVDFTARGSGRSTSRATTCGSASATSSSATKASAR